MPQFISKYPHSADLLNDIETLVPLIESAASESEQQGCLRQDVIDALIDKRLFRLFLAEQLEGEATDLSTALRAFERIAMADGATGWQAMIGAGGGLFAGFMGQNAAREIFLPERALIAGCGVPSGVAEPGDNGFTINGRWSYASGAHHASWFTANCQVEGRPGEIVSIAVPAQQVEIHNTWSVFGMCATGSEDFSVDGVTVAPEFTFSLDKEPLLDSPIYRCPFAVVASLSFTSVATGIAVRALQEFSDYAAGKTMLGNEQLLGDDQDVKRRVGNAEQLIEGARGWLYEFAGIVWECAEGGDRADEGLVEQVSQGGIEAVQNCIVAVDQLYARAGMMPLFADSVFGRAWRDLRVLGQNVVVAAR